MIFWNLMDRFHISIFSLYKFVAVIDTSICLFEICFSKFLFKRNKEIFRWKFWIDLSFINLSYQVFYSSVFSLENKYLPQCKLIIKVKFDFTLIWKFMCIKNILIRKYTLCFFYKQLGSSLSPQNCLHFQGFWGSKLLNGSLVVWPSNLYLWGIQWFSGFKTDFTVIDFKFFPKMLFRQLNFGVLSV